MATPKDITAKTAINLAQRAKKSYKLSRRTLAVLAFVTLLLLLVQVAIVNPWQLAKYTEMQAEQQEALLQQTRQALVNFDAVRDTYEIERQTQPGLFGAADVMGCLTLIEEELLLRSRVHSFTIGDDQITVRLSGVTLNEMSAIYQRLMASPLVSGVQVYTAAAGKDGDKRATASMTITLAAPDAAEGLTAEIPAEEAEEGGVS